MEGTLRIQVIHVAGTRMIAQLTDVFPISDVTISCAKVFGELNAKELL